MDMKGLTINEMIALCDEYLSGQDDQYHGQYDPRYVQFMRQCRMLFEEMHGSIRDIENRIVNGTGADNPVGLLSQEGWGTK